MNYKKVLLPVKVPRGKFCCNLKKGVSICIHFDNEGGTPSCTMGLGNLVYTEEGNVYKGRVCAQLEEIKEGDVLFLY